MKKIKPLLTCFLLFASYAIFAQVQIDKQLQLTGSGSDAEITGVQAVANGTDAANASSIQQGALIYAADGGTANAYAVTLAPTVTAYTTGMVVNFKAANANTGASTLAVNGLTPQTIKKQVTTDLAANDILANQSVSVIYDGTNFQMLSLLGNAGAQAPTYTIGLHPELGGYVFYLTANSQHGVVAETQDQDQGSGDTWFDAQNLINNPANHSAAGQNFANWRLPTLYELNELYAARSAIGGFEGGFFIAYWSSIIANFNSGGYAWYMNFNGGSTGNDLMSNNHYIRAVRNF